MQQFADWAVQLVTAPVGWFAVLLPVVLILSMNVIIVRSLRKMHDFRRSQTMLQSRTSSLSIMLVAASVAMIVLISPNLISLAYLNYKTSQTSDPASLMLYAIIRIATRCLHLFNNACNFIIYCISGKRFRSELSLMFACKGSDEEDTTKSTLSKSS